MGNLDEEVYRGSVYSIVAGRINSESLASFTTGDLYDHHDTEGFINLFGLSLKVRAMVKENAEK